MLDDDITGFKCRLLVDGKLKTYPIDKLDYLLDYMMEYMESSSNMNLLSFTHSSFYVAGANGPYSKGLDMLFSQAMLFKLDKFEPWFFRGLEEDFNINLTDLFNLHYNIFQLCVESPAMQSNSSVIDVCVSNNRALYSYIINPTCVDVLITGKRRVKRDNFIPKLISNSYKK